jgi:dTMP kinase
MARAQGEDRFEREGHEFHQRVREGYLRIAQQDPQRIRVISGAGDQMKIQEEIRRIIRPFLQWS